ncbi:CHAT domain-containing protein [Streptomyces silvisoli]|uniref:CHAT domain-containing protein n=1 Tax=Streptomyces silvisoli TaxID=3034235 RepID=A0ABT5ZQH1_9ACTN|nr:CHAT domain-containing protein [Streptomyces silvisoli]MDF3291850.1 CHAT domain-containing protein [Streptomyces silvisoli]
MTSPTPFDNEIERNRQRAARGSVNATNDLAMALRDRHRLTGDPADLLEGIARLRTAIGYTRNHPVKYTLRVSLSALLLDHFQHFGDVCALHEALAGCDKALPLLAGENRLTAAMVRVDALVLLAERTRDPEYAAEAVESASRLPRTPGVQLVLGKALRMRYELTYDRGALVDAAEVLEEGVRATAVDDPNYLLVLNQLGNVLQCSAEDTGDESVRETAIRHLRAAVARTPSASQALLHRKVDLAAALRVRGRQTGDVAALREGVVLLREVLAATRAGTRPWGNRCENYLIAVLELVERTGDIELLDQAVEVGRSAHGQGSDDATIPLLLGLLHHQRFLRTRLRRDLAQAITAFTEVVRTIPYGERNHVAALGNQGRVWFSEYGFSGDPEALRRAVTALGSAVRASAPGTVGRGQTQINYGDALYAQYELSLDPGVLTSAGHAFREAVEIEALPPMARIRAARAWARTKAETGQWREARDAYACAVGLLPLVVPRRLARVDQQRALAELNGLAADAAASALWADAPETAVRLLELGRGVLGGQVLQSRSDLSRLHAVAPELAERLDDAFDRLIPSGHLMGAAADERHDLDVRLSHLLDEVRALPGFADFLAPPGLAELLASAAAGPVVLINVSRYRSDALIVQPSGITPVQLPDVTPDSVADQAAALGAALAASTRPGAGETDAQTTVTGILGWLWDFVAEPVLKRLGHTTTPSDSWPRVWWSPVGQLALLPIHAAGHYPDSATVLDRVVSSYTPTLRALRHAKARRTRADGDLVVVAIGDAPGAKTLRSVEREATHIAALTSATRLDGAQATVDAVRAALPSHGSAHFACHGVSDPDDPSASHLLLHDGPLSVLDLSALDLSGVRLAVLSACETSLGAHWIPDESLHLVSAFQLAGYPQVVGTLWQVNDLVARQVAVDLHEGIAAGEDAAMALHHAVRRCRERFHKSPTLWAAHLHSGR